MVDCKICSLSEAQRADVEKRINTGRSYQVIANELKKEGVVLSAVQITRHRANHMDQGNKPDLKSTTAMTPVIIDTIDLTEADAKLKQSLLSRDYQKEAVHQRMQTHVLLERIATKQMFIVDDLLSKYAQGIGSYPNDQIRGMKITLDLIEKLPTYADKTMLYKINEMSQKARKLKIEH